MGKRRHFAMSVPDRRKTAESCKYAFGTEVVGETDSSLAEGVFLPDGVINGGGMQKNPGGYGNGIGPSHARARAELALCRQAKLRFAERGGRVRG